MNFLQKLFRKPPVTDLKAIAQKAAIIDVRTADEYKSGHIKPSINIPLQRLPGMIRDIQKLNKPVITCCASGIRSGMAKKILEKAGIETYNGGGWNSLQSKLR